MDTSKHFLKGIEISSTRDILLYCLNNQHLTVKADGYLALPTRNLGLVYVVASYRPYDRYSKANIAVISAHDNNAVIIFLNKNVAVQSRSLLYDEGASLYITLEKLEALYISSSSDLSGTLVLSRKPVSVISGVDSAFPTGSTGQTAFFESFLLPVSLWANYYILTAVGTMNKRYRLDLGTSGTPALSNTSLLVCKELQWTFIMIKYIARCKNRCWINGKFLTVR